MSINLNLERKKHNNEITLKIKGWIVTDYIVEIAPIRVVPEDTLTVTVNLDINGYVDGVQTSTHTERYSYMVDHLTESKTARYIRFTKHLSNASIQVYDKLPTDFYNPPVWNAKRKEL